MNTTYTANENCFLIDGEVCLVDNNKIDKYWLYVDKYTGLVDGTVEKNVLPDSWYEKLHDKDCYKNVTHSTNKNLDNIVLLPRDKFVKPVEQEAKEYALAQGENARNYAVAHDFICGRGKFEFTREEMITAICNAVFKTSAGKFVDIDEYMASIRPLSLPASVKINEQGEIVNVIW